MDFLVFLYTLFPLWLNWPNFAYRIPKIIDLTLLSSQRLDWISRDRIRSLRKLSLVFSFRTTATLTLILNEFYTGGFNFHIIKWQILANYLLNGNTYMGVRFFSGGLCELSSNLILKCNNDIVNNKYRGCFTSDNEPGGIENATHNTFPKLTWLF
jgi:hypothetical protein